MPNDKIKSHTQDGCQHSRSKLFVSLRKQRWLSVLSLVLVLSGCASSRVSILPDGHHASKGKTEAPHVLEVGDEAIVTLLDGKVITGKVISIKPGSVVLGRIGNFGYDETQIESHSIKSMEWTNNGSIWPYLVGVAAVSVLWVASKISQLD